MLEASEPDLVVHFPGGNGTGDMVALARDAGITTLGGLATAEEQMELFSEMREREDG